MLFPGPHVTSTDIFSNSISHFCYWPFVPEPGLLDTYESHHQGTYRRATWTVQATARAYHSHAASPRRTCCGCAAWRFRHYTSFHPGGSRWAHRFPRVSFESLVSCRQAQRLLYDVLLLPPLRKNSWLIVRECAGCRPCAKHGIPQSQSRVQRQVQGSNPVGNGAKNYCFLFLSQMDLVRNSSTLEQKQNAWPCGPNAAFLWAFFFFLFPMMLGVFVPITVQGQHHQY